MASWKKRHVTVPNVSNIVSSTIFSSRTSLEEYVRVGVSFACLLLVKHTIRIISIRIWLVRKYEPTWLLRKIESGFLSIYLLIPALIVIIPIYVFLSLTMCEVRNQAIFLGW